MVQEDVGVMLELKNLSNYWRTLEMYLTYCEINLIFTCSDKCVLSNDTKATTFAITDTKLNVLVITLLTQNNAKLLRQLKSAFKGIINWNKYQLKVTKQAPNSYLYCSF